jgi:hypothetical protein
MMKARSIPRQRGAALLALLAVLVLGASWFLVSRLDALSADFTARDRVYNAAVLNRAKQALIGYVAAQAVKAGENNPGSLPCPENPGDFDSTTGREGLIGTACGSSLKVGRFPWRTIGTEKLVDASGEPLWYVVSMNWGVPSAGNTSINSSSLGQLALDGVIDAVALIIAPGPAINVSGVPGCAVWSQARSPTGTPDWRNYLECENATSPANAAFISTGPSGSFNDQVIKITAAEILPGIEAAIANRIEREIAPALRTVFASNLWATNISAANPVLPFAAPFANPTTSNYQGAAALTAGLLPFNQMVGCNPATDPRCTTTLIAWSSGTPPTSYKASGYGYVQTQTCSWQSGGDVAECQGEYHEDDTSAFALSQQMRIEMSVTLNNVAMGLRTIDTVALAGKMTVEARDDTCAPGCPWQSQAVTHTKTLNSNGSMTFTFGATLPNIDVMGWGTYAQFRVRFDRTSIFGDHALLSSADATTGWFVRNEWYRLLYYATAAGYTAATLPAAPSCNTGMTCLSVANGDPTRPITPAGGQRAILIFAGSSVAGQTRPSATRGDYFEFANATGTGALALPFERQPVKKSRVVNAALKAPFNDRIIVIGSN